MKQRGLSYLFIGIALILVGWLLFNRFVSADTANLEIAIPSGFSAYPAEVISTLNQSEIKTKNLRLFSFNDPQTQFKNWLVYGPDCTTYQNSEQGKCVSSISPTQNLSYYLYNPNSNSVNLSRKSSTNPPLPQGKVNSGWHIISWSGNEIKQSEFLKRQSLINSSSQLSSLEQTISNRSVSKYIFKIDRSSGSIIHKMIGEQDSEQTTSKINNNDSLWVYVFNSNFSYASFAKQNTSDVIGNFQFGLNLNPGLDLNKNNTFAQEKFNLGLTFLRYINFDNFQADRSNNLAFAKKMKTSGVNLLGNLLPQGSVQPDRKSTLLSSKGKKYETAEEIISDIQLYSGYDSNGKKIAPQWQKLKNLLIQNYFKTIAIPRVTLYKGTIDYWQPWNEPDGKLSTAQWAIPAEALALITTGKVKTSSGEVSFGNSKITGLDGKKYDISKGTYGLVKQICPDCKVVSAGFYRKNKAYFTTLKENNYIDYVDANEIHLNLFPNNTMSYTRYWTEIESQKEIYDWLCGGRENCKKPLYSTEIGSPSGIKFVEKLNNQNTGFTMTFSDNFQSDDLIKRFVSLPALGVNKVNWNGYQDNLKADYIGRSCPTSKNSAGFYEMDATNALCAHPLKGIYAKSSSGAFTKKTSYNAYQIATDMLNYASKVDILQSGDSAHNIADATFIFKITDTDKTVKFAAWCDPYWNITTPDKKAWNYEDKKCQKDIDLTKYGAKGAITIIDKTGSAKEQKANSVAISQSPAFIVLR